MIKWLHHLFNPHCPDCRIEQIEKSHCVSCDTLKMEIEQLRHHNDRLLEMIIDKPKPIEATLDIQELKPLQPRHIPLSVRRERFEAEDRRIAQRLRDEAPKPDAIDKKKELQDLNKELEDVRHTSQKES